jgi:predicted alternative tryptophan synthase beta-subunit
MDNIVNTVKTSIGGLFAVLTSVIGLLVLAQVVFGEEAGMNVIANLQNIVNGFVGEGASLAGLITLLLIVGLLQKQNQ